MSSFSQQKPMKERRLAKNAKNGMVKSASKMIGNNPKLSSFFNKVKAHTRLFDILAQSYEKKILKVCIFPFLLEKKHFFIIFIFTNLTRTCRKKYQDWFIFTYVTDQSIICQKTFRKKGVYEFVFELERKNRPEQNIKNLQFYVVFGTICMITQTIRHFSV